MKYAITTVSMIACLGLGQAAIGQNAETSPTYDNQNTTNTSRYDETRDVSEWFGPQEGAWEMTIAGSGGSDKDVETGSFNADIDLSYYFSELVSAGVRQNVGYIDTAGSNDWNAATSVFSQLHFGDTPLRPFVGVSVGYLYGDGVNDTFFGGPEAGLRYYVKPETFIFGRASYQFLFESGDEIDDQFDDGRFVYTLGVGFTF